MQVVCEYPLGWEILLGIEMQHEPDFGTDNWMPCATTSEWFDGGDRWWNRLIYNWETPFMKNYGARFRGVVFSPAFPPWYPEEYTFYLGPREWQVHNTVVSSENEVLLYDGTNNVTVAWGISHFDYDENDPDDDPDYTVTVTISEIDSGSVVRTIILLHEHLYERSVEWDGKDNMGQPVEAGVYAYKVHAIHPAEHTAICDDQDKSRFLEVSGTGVSQVTWLAGNSYPPEVHMFLEYDLSRDAASVTLEVYDYGLGRTPIIMPPDGELPATAGHHEIGVQFQVCPPHAGYHWLVIHATETAETGQYNRDLQPKFALQDGVRYGIWPPAHAAAGRDGWNPLSNAAIAHAAEVACDAWTQTMPPYGSKFAGTHAQASEQVDVVYEKMDTRPLGVLFTVTHASAVHLSFDEAATLDEYDLFDAGYWDPPNHLYSIEYLDGGDLSEYVLVFFMGCDTAFPGGAGGTWRFLMDAVLAKGAAVFAGFEGGITIGYMDDYSQGFWDVAVQPGMTIDLAHNSGLNAVWASSGGDSKGFDTFFTSDWNLEVYPARFNGNPICAAP